MRQLTYISTARSGLSDEDVAAILTVSRRNNRRDGLTGILIHDGRRFLQALEGKGSSLEACYARIKADPRHRAAVQLSYREIEEREFGAWDMACERVSSCEPGGSLGEMVAAMVGEVQDPNLRAMLAGFARMDRKAA